MYTLPLLLSIQGKWRKMEYMDEMLIEKSVKFSTSVELETDNVCLCVRHKTLGMTKSC